MRGAEAAPNASGPAASRASRSPALCVLVAVGARRRRASCCPIRRRSLAPASRLAHLAETGLGNPVTAVLIAYRAFDTMLEKVVLFAGGDRGLVAGCRPLLGRRAGRGSRRAARADARLPRAGSRADRPSGRGPYFLGRRRRAGRRLPGRRHSRRHVDDRDDGAARRSARDQRLLAEARADRWSAVFLVDRRRRRARRWRVLRLSEGLRKARHFVHRGLHGPLHRGLPCRCWSRVRRGAGRGHEPRRPSPGLSAPRSSALAFTASSPMRIRCAKSSRST